MSESNLTQLQNTSLNELMNKAQKLDIKLPPHPTKKQLIQILSNQKYSSQQIHSFNDSKLSSPIKESKKTLQIPSNATPNTPDVIIIPREAFKNTTENNKIIVKREQSPLLTTNKRKNTKKSQQKIPKENLFDRKNYYTRKIYTTLLIVLCFLIFINPFFFICAILCLLGMLFSEQIAKGLVLIENCAHFFKFE